MEPEILVSLSLRLPQADRTALADHLSPLLREAIIASGDKVRLIIQPYDPHGDD